jgi:hypothetical protein
MRQHILDSEACQSPARINTPGTCNHLMKTIEMSHLVSGKRKLSTSIDFNEDCDAISTEIVTQICPHDVLLGKGPLSHRNPGNMKFRDIIRSRQNEYTQTNRRRLKDLIAHQIVASVESQGGRFLKCIESTHANVNENLDNLETCWKIVDPATALEKVKQSLRDCNVRRNSELSTREQQSVRAIQFTRSASLSSEHHQVVVNHFDNSFGGIIGDHRERSHNDEISHLVNNLLLSHTTGNQLLSIADNLERYLQRPLLNLDHGSILSALLNPVIQQSGMPLHHTLLLSTLHDAILSSERMIDHNNSLTNWNHFIQSLSLLNISNFQHNMDNPAISFALNVLVATLVQSRGIDRASALSQTDPQFQE